MEVSSPVTSSVVTRVQHPASARVAPPGLIQSGCCCPRTNPIAQWPQCPLKHHPIPGGPWWMLLHLVHPCPLLQCCSAAGHEPRTNGTKLLYHLDLTRGRAAPVFHAGLSVMVNHLTLRASPSQALTLPLFPTGTSRASRPCGDGLLKVVIATVTVTVTALLIRDRPCASQYSTLRYP